jgi:hypothetical protein
MCVSLKAVPAAGVGNNAPFPDANISVVAVVLMLVDTVASALFENIHLVIIFYLIR